MSKKRFTWKTEKLQHLDDEVLLVVDNENKEWEGHILNIVDLLNELSDENGQLKDENEQLRKQCFELEKDYVIETSDISDKIYLDDEIRELKQRYGVDGV